MSSISVTLGQSSSIYEFDAGPAFLNTKNYFYDNGEEVIVFDAQFSPEVAEQSIKFIRSKTKNPITYVIILHPSIDKFNGLSAFQAVGATVIASIKTEQAMPAVYEYKTTFFLDGGGRTFGFTKENWPKLGRIDSTFDNSLRLELKNGQAIILRDLSKPGTSANHTVAFIAEEEALFVGDLVHYQVHANFDGVLVEGKPLPFLASWIDNLNDLKRIFKNDSYIMVYGGRGMPVSLPTAVWEQTRYLKNAYNIILPFYDANRSAWEGTNVPPRYLKELQAEMESAFPTFKLSYLTRAALLNCWHCAGAEKIK